MGSKTPSASHPPLEALGEVEAAAIMAGGGRVFGAVRVGQLGPVGDDPNELAVAQAGALGDQHRLVTGKAVLRLRAAGSGQEADLGSADLAGHPCCLSGRHVAQLPAQADPVPGGRAGQPAAGSHPRAAERAPSASQLPPLSKAAVARVVTASKRVSWRCRASMVSPSARTAGSASQSASTAAVNSLVTSVMTGIAFPVGSTRP